VAQSSVSFDTRNSCQLAVIDAEGAGVMLTLTWEDRLSSDSQAGSLSKARVPQQGVSTDVKE